MEFRVEKIGMASILFVELSEGEAVKAESGAMVSMKGDIEIKTSTGGLFKALGRALFGGESLFMNTFIAKGKAEVALAPKLPGDVEVLDLSGTVYVQSSSYLASSPDIEVSTKFGGFKSFFAGEGFFLLKVSGTGKLALSSFGGIYVRELDAGERMTVDTGHVVAFDESVSYSVRTFGGLKSFLFGGEGLVVDFVGPGRVFIQTRNYPDFVEWIKVLAKSVVERD